MNDNLRLVYRLSYGLIALLAGSSAIGLVAGFGGLYEPYPPSEAGLFAQDLVILLVALPILVAGMWLTARGSVVGLPLWGGALFYAAYTFYFMTIGAFTVLFPAYLAIIALATYGLLSLLARTDVARLAARFGKGLPRRSIAAFFGVTVAVFVVLWGGLVASSLAGGEVLNPVQHLVVAIDAAILLPILAYGAVLLLRRAPLGTLLAGLLIVKAGMTGFTLAFTGAFAMWWSDAFDVSEAFLVVIFTVMTFVSVGLWIPYARSARASTAGERRGAPGSGARATAC